MHDSRQPGHGQKKRSCELKTALADASSIVQIGLIQEKNCHLGKHCNICFKGIGINQKFFEMFSRIWNKIKLTYKMKKILQIELCNHKNLINCMEVHILFISSPLCGGSLHFQNDTERSCMHNTILHFRC